jgi:hypothetical protein
MLAGALRSLIEAPGGVRVLDWYSEDLDAAIRHADVVIVDMPPNLHERTFAVIGGRFLGRMIVLLQEGEHAEALPPGPPRAILYRPVQIGELWMAVTGATSPVTADPEPPGPEGTPPSEGAQAGPAASQPEAPEAQVGVEPPPEAPRPEPEAEVEPGPEAQGLPVAESGRLIGLSGQELDPVVGPGQVAPGLDPATLERLRGWGSQGSQPAARGTGQAPAARRTTGREEARQAKAAQAEARRAERAAADQAKAAVRRAARAEAKQAKAAAAEARREQSRQVRAQRAEARDLARAEAGEARAARVAARKVARAEARQAEVARAEERRAARLTADEARGAKVAARKVARAESRQARMARAGVAGEDLAPRMARPAVVMLAMAAVGLAAAGLSAGGGPDTLAGEVAVARAAGGGQGGLVTQDPRIGPIEPLHALAVGAWLRTTEAGGSLEETIRAARVPSRFLLAGVVALTVLLFLLLMRVGLGTGAAAGPGPAPPQGGERGRGQLWRLAGAVLAGALVALDPVLVRNGREATGTVLAVTLAMGALAAAWGLPARSTLRWLPLVAAVGGLALLVSPLALPLLAVPVVAELLQGRYREAWRGMAALGLGIGLWLALPIWVAGQGLDAAQAGWLLGRPPGRGPIPASVAEAPLSWVLVAAALAAAAGLTWRHRSDARQAGGPQGTRLVAWTATTAAGALVAVVLGYPADQALPFAVPAAAVSLAMAGMWTITTAGGDAPARRRLALAGLGVALAGLLVAQVVDWAARYGPSSADNGLARLVAAVADQVPGCSAVNAGGPHDRARLVAGGATVTGYSDGAAAKAAGVRYFVLTGAASQGGSMSPSLAAWVRRNGTRLAAFPSRSLSGLELWRVESPPLDPVADSVPVPGGLFSNLHGSACGGHSVVDDQVGAFYSAYQAYGGKAVLGRPLGSVWTSDGPALQVFDTMVLGTVPAAGGPPAVRPVDLPPLLAKLDAAAVADADIPLPSARAPVTDQQAQAMLRDRTIARAYLGTDPATASATNWQQARDRFGRPLGLPQVMPDGAVRQTFERVVLELPADGGPARPAALGRLALRLGLVPKQAMRLEPEPGLPTPPAETRLDTGPLLRLAGGGLALLVLAAGAGVVVARRSGPAHSR